MSHQVHDRNFLGIPVSGDIRGADSRTPQRPLEELSPLFQAVLDDPTIEWFGWRQYTPYFNDGEPCLFSVHGALGVGLVPDPDNSAGTDDYDTMWEGVEYSGTLGRRNRSYEERPGEYTGPDEARYERCLALEQALESGAFDDILLKTFGDHATVIVRRTGIEVQEYSHD